MDEFTARDDWTGEISYDKYVEILKLLETLYLDEQMNIQNEKIKELQLMSSFCNRINMCQRKSLLSYLGEKFDAKNCNNTCGNCIAKI